MKKPKPVPMKPTKMWAIVDAGGQLLNRNMSDSQRDADARIATWYDARADDRVVKVLITEVTR
jgi:hypothetical protein